MITRRLGPDGPDVSVLSLGSWHTWDRAELADSVETVRAAVEGGVNFFEVAHYNSGPHTEGLNADVLFSRIAAEAGLRREDYLLEMKLWLWNLEHETLRQSLERQLYRVGTDHIDVAVFGHFEIFRKDWVDWSPLQHLSLEDIVHQMASFIDEGLVKSWGVCNWSASVLKEAYEIAKRDSLPLPQFAQLKYGVTRRSIPEGDLYREFFAETGLSLQASDTLEGGILAGKVDTSRVIARDAGGIRDEIRGIFPEFKELAESLGGTPAQLAIAFCLTNPTLASILMGTTKASQMRENLGGIALYEKHGDSIRDLTQHFWLDREVGMELAS